MWRGGRVQRENRLPPTPFWLAERFLTVKMRRMPRVRTLIVGIPLLLAAMLATLLEEDIVNQDFIDEHTADGEGIFELLRTIPIAEYCGHLCADAIFEFR